MMRFQPRYSLRSLLIAAGLVALAVYWLTLPSRQAYELERAVRSQTNLDSIRLSGGGKFELLTDHGTEDQIRRATVRIEPLTWRQFLGAERYVYVHIPYGVGMFEWDKDILIRATPRGLQIIYWMT